MLATRRALALLSLALALASAGCSSVPDTFACAHCACGTAARTVSRPMLCSTFGRDAACCMPELFGS